MPKRYILVITLSLIGLLLALIGMLVYFTQAMGVQIIIFQSLYWNLDRVGGIGRIIVYFLVAFAASMYAIFHYRELSDKLNTRWLGYMILFSVAGLLLGLVVFYANVCCDSPVIFHFGFPLSWIYGITSSWHSLPSSTNSYLIRNFSNFKWNMDPRNLFENLIFWFNVSFLFFAIRKPKWNPGISRELGQ
jgi:hypothetical protein